MRSITITVALALVTLVTALRAAWLWRKASLRMPRLIDFIAGSGDHVVQVEREVYGAVSRSAFKHSVFSRVARASASYSVTAARPSCARGSFLKRFLPVVGPDLNPR